MTTARLWGCLFLLLVAGMLFTRSEFQKSYHREVVPIADAGALEVIASRNDASVPDEAGPTGEPTPETPHVPADNHAHGQPDEQHAHGHAHGHASGATCLICDGLKATTDQHHHDPSPPGGKREPSLPADHQHHEGDTASSCLVCGSAHDHHGHDKPPSGEEEDPVVSTGMVLILRQLGLAELAANLLWLQMDTDSHAGLWHRVEFYLALIPQIDPHFTEAYLLQAHIYGRVKKEHATAMKALETGLANNPESYDLLLEMAVTCLNVDHKHGPERRLAKAHQTFLRLTSLYPDCPGFIHRMLAITLAAQEKRQEAIALLSGLSADPQRTERDLAHDQWVISRIQNGEQF